jgi:hypothetical protein
MPASCLRTSPVPGHTRLTSCTCASGRCAPRPAFPSSAGPCQGGAGGVSTSRSGAHCARRSSQAAIAMARRARRKVEGLGKGRCGIRWVRGARLCSSTLCPIARPVRCLHTRAAPMSVRINAQGWRLPRPFRGSGISTPASSSVLYLRSSITHHPLCIAVRVIVGDGQLFYEDFDTALGDRT